MAKRLLFLKKENINKVKKSKNDKVIFLGGESNNSVKAYKDNIARKSNQTIYGYNLLWTQKWAFKKLDNGKSFVEELVFDNVSLWNFIEHFLHRWNKPWMEEPPISEILLDIDSAKKIIDEIKPNKVVIENTKTDFNQQVLKICEKRGIKVRNLGLKKVFTFDKHFKEQGFEVLP